MPVLPFTTLTLIGAFTGLVLVSACANDGEKVRPEPPKVAPLSAVLSDASVALKAGQADKAQALLRQAATSYPADKAPWLQLAQIKFDRASYGEAITNAQEALRRDPADKLAYSIAAASGLRVSATALSQLGAQNDLAGPLRSEAQEMARLLRTTLRDEPPAPGAALPGRVKGGAAARKGAAKNQPNDSDPFDSLK
ncbi:hypothetical protein ASF61_16340 [Duganella sp. Leaf126]|nr:hypothetical protein ASF61_16340 [Duganella sp. Leaf126]